MKHCSNCGNSLIRDAKFCGSCGKKVTSPKKSGAKKAESDQQSRKTSSKKVTLFVVVALAIYSFLFSSATLIQILPFALFTFLAYQDIWRNVKTKEAIVSLSIVMLIINFFLALEDPYVFVDVILWIVIGIIFAKN